MKHRIGLVLGVLVFVHFPVWAGASEPNAVGDVKEPVVVPPASVVERYRLDPFYQKYLDADGIAVTSSANVADAALHEVQYLIGHALASRPDLLKAMSQGHTRIVVIGAAEEVSEIPEYYRADPEDAARQNRRVRGYGGMRLISCGEENLLNYANDRYRGENIFLHEFAHSLHSHLRRLDPDFQETLERLYSETKEKGLWERTYAGTNAAEYWAEGLQDYWDCNRQSRGERADGVHNAVNTRAELKAYDPALFGLIDETFRQMAWHYTRYSDRQSN